jgi:hypothetical protein
MLQRIFLLSGVFVFVSFFGLAQESLSLVDSVSVYTDIFSTLQDNSRGGKIEIYQDPALHVLVDKSIRINKKEGLDGYRIQIFSSSGQEARDLANETQQKFLELFPDFDSRLIYTEYTAPYFKLRIGDFRNKNEAYEFFHKLRKKFPSSYIVKSKINFPKLEANQL